MKKESKWVSDSVLKDFPNVITPDGRGFVYSAMFGWALDMVNTELYVVSQHGWYCCDGYLGVFKTEKEALDYLGFKDLEEFHEYNRRVYYSEGFHGYKIEKRTFKGLMEERFKSSLHYLLDELEDSLVDKTKKEIKRFDSMDISHTFYRADVPIGMGN